MADLIAKSPLAGHTPKTVAGVTLSEVNFGHLTSIAPYNGQWEACSAALEAAHGMALPGPNRFTRKARARAIWFGREMALLCGPAPDASLAAHAAITDQTDAWTCVTLEGEVAEDMLARLVPIDLRRQAFRRGRTARTQLQHMNASISRIGPNTFLIMVFRSMADTLRHDIETVMESWVARR